MAKWKFLTLVLFLYCSLPAAPLSRAIDQSYRSRIGLGILTLAVSTSPNPVRFEHLPTTLAQQAGILARSGIESSPIEMKPWCLQLQAFHLDSIPVKVDTVRASASLNFIASDEKIKLQRTEIGDRYYYTPVDSLYLGADLTFTFSIRKQGIDFFGSLLVITDSEEARNNFLKLSEERQTQLRRSMMDLPALFEDYEEQLYIKYYPYGYNEALRRGKFQWRNTE